MEAAGILARVREAFPDAVVADDAQARDPTVQVAPRAVPEVLAFLRDDADLRFDFLMAVTGVDLLGVADPPVLRVVYHLFSYAHRHTLVVRADVPRDQPQVPSVSTLYPTATWHEREAFDLLGIRFEGHPDLRRILLPEEWQGHPLRKDWVEGETALGYSTRRSTLMDLLRGASGPAKGE